MAIKLYMDPFSVASRRVTVCAHELGIEYEPVHIHMLRGEHMTPDYTSKNPNQKVPTLEEDGWRLWESSAIMQYLCWKKPEKGLYPGANEARLHCEVSQWVAWGVTHLSIQGVWTLVQERFFKVAANMPQWPRIPAREAEALENANRYCAIANGALEGKTWIVGDRFTVADIVLAAEFMHNERAQFSLSPFPHLNAHFERVKSRDSWKATEPKGV